VITTKIVNHSETKENMGIFSFRRTCLRYSPFFIFKDEVVEQPSGTVNMSRIDNAQLKFDMTNVANLPAPSSQWSGAVGRIAIYATNYNVFRVMSGMGGFEYQS
jgi:hypothetical protein